MLIVLHGVKIYAFAIPGVKRNARSEAVWSEALCPLLYME